MRDLKTANAVIVAPARTLSVLRETLDRATSSKLLAELAHDLVNHPIGDIETYLGRVAIAS